MCGTQNGVLVSWPWGTWGDRSNRFRGEDWEHLFVPFSFVTFEPWSRWFGSQAVPGYHNVVVSRCERVLSIVYLFLSRRVTPWPFLPTGVCQSCGRPVSVNCCGQPVFVNHWSISFCQPLRSTGLCQPLWSTVFCQLLWLTCFCQPLWSTTLREPLWSASFINYCLSNSFCQPLWSTIFCQPFFASYFSSTIVVNQFCRVSESSLGTFVAVATTRIVFASICVQGTLDHSRALLLGRER